MKLYKIGDICDLLTITPRTIRYYDQLGLLPNTKRSDGYTRLFDQHDIDTIKSIRHLQKTKSLPLNIIKDQLFPSNIKSTNIVLLTDSYSYKTLPLSPDLTIIPLDETASNHAQSKQIYQYIHDNLSNSAIFICFFHESLSASYISIANKFSDNTYFLYPLKHYGMTHYMITDYINSNLHNYSNLTELHLVINRLITLGFSLCLLDSLDYYVSVDQNVFSSHSFLESVTAYHPILLSTNQAESVVSFEPNFFANSDAIALRIDTLLQKQKRYVEAACIFYTHSNRLAQALQQSLKSYCPNLSCSTLKISNWSYHKNQVNFISII